MHLGPAIALYGSRLRSRSKSNKVKQMEENMNKSIFTKLTTLLSSVALCAIALTISANSQGDKSGNVRTTISPVHRISNGDLISQAGGQLSRNNSGVLGQVSAGGLTPGHVVTMWWAIYNNPEFCATPGCTPADFNNPLVNGSLQYGGGTIVGVGGRADFSGYLAEGDNSGFYLNPMFPNMPNPSPGIVDAKRATIHLALRSHGPPSADPAVLALQLTTFPGGCSAMNPCATLYATMFLQ